MERQHLMRGDDRVHCLGLSLLRQVRKRQRMLIFLRKSLRSNATKFALNFVSDLTHTMHKQHNELPDGMNWTQGDGSPVREQRHNRTVPSVRKEGLK